jgi:RecB family exonuclease
MTQPDLFGFRSEKLQVPKKELLIKFYAEAWVDDWFADKIQKENYRKLGLTLLENFYEKFSQDPKLPKFLEKSFRLKLGDYKFTGKIDRGDANSDGSVDIVDYKTGQAREKLSPVDKEQLLIYQWAAQEEFREKVSSLRYWYLNSLDESIKFTGTREEIEELKLKLLKTIEQIVETVRNASFYELDMRTAHACRFRHLEG